MWPEAFPVATIDESPLPRLTLGSGRPGGRNSTTLTEVRYRSDTGHAAFEYLGRGIRLGGTRLKLRCVPLWCSYSTALTTDF